MCDMGYNELTLISWFVGSLVNPYLGLDQMSVSNRTYLISVFQKALVDTLLIE